MYLMMGDVGGGIGKYLIGIEELFVKDEMIVGVMVEYVRIN